MRRAAWRRLSPRQRLHRALDLRPRIGRRAFVVMAVLAAFTVLTLGLPLYAVMQAEESAQALDAMLAEYDPGEEQVGTACGGALAEIVERTEIPLEALAAYCSAAGARSVDWTILAGIGKRECDHGRSPLAGCNPRGTVNSAGARGPMQFVGSTWRTGSDPFALDVSGPPIPDGDETRGYATDGDGDGVADPWTWLDATHAAARHLVRNKVSEDPRHALYAYNPTWDYVDGVVATAAEYRRAVADLVPAGGPGSPLGSTERYTERGLPVTTQRLLDTVVPMFGQGYDVFCFGKRDGPSDHPAGRACDFMMAPIGTMPNQAYLDHGWALANWLVANADAYDVSYVIWQNRIWSSERRDEGWRPYTRYPGGNLTQKHYDHIHVSVY
jgi:hypothetical protein